MTQYDAAGSHPHRWMPRSIAARAAQVLKEEGPKSLAFRTLGELGYRRVALLERALPALEEHPWPAGVRYELLTPECFGDFRAISQLCDETEARRRLAQGHLCQLGYVDGQPASCCWLALSGQSVRLGFVDLDAELAPGYGYTYELYVAPEHRGTGLVNIGFQDRVRLFRANGVRRLAAVVMPENRAGLRYVLTAGYRPVGSIHRVRFPGYRRSWVRCETSPPPLAIVQKD